MSTFQHALIECPKCLHQMDRSTGPEPPRTGDVTICIRCGQMLIFEADLQVRVPAEDELNELVSDRRIAILQALVRKFHCNQVSVERNLRQFKRRR